jgi:glutamine synthetase
VEALDALEKDTVIGETLGSEIVASFVRMKRKEWSEYANFAVTDWEWDTYSSR